MSGYRKMYYGLKKTRPDLEDWQIRQMVEQHFKQVKGREYKAWKKRRKVRGVEYV